MFSKSIYLAFVAGVAVGTAICYVYDKYYRKKETVTVTKYVYGDKEADNTPKKEEVFRPAGDTSVVNDVYHKIIQMPSNEPNANPADAVSDLAEGIREITPDDFAFDNFYSKVTLRYYKKDGILVDENEETVEELAETISVEGPDCIGHFIPEVGYFRNDNLHIDYEVIEDERSYHEIRGVEEGTFIS